MMKLFCLLLAIIPSQIYSQGFIPNHGQIKDQFGRPNTSVLFILPGDGMNIHLRRDGFSYELWQVKGMNPGKRIAGETLLNVVQEISRVDVKFKGEKTEAEIQTGDPGLTRLNYYNELGAFVNIPVFSSVCYKEIYKHTDILFSFDPARKQFKYDLILHPGADLSAIRFLIEGAEKLKMEGNELHISTQNGNLSESIPLSYYSADKTQNIPCKFVLNGNEYSFQSNFDPGRTFIIDPASTRLWGTYYGDAGVDYGQDVANDANGNVYLTGYTLSNTNIATTGTYQSSLSGSFDAFIAKFDVNGVRLWGTYFGGNSVEAAYAVTISASGAVYISGDTFSTSGVASLGAHQTTYGGGIDDAFLARFDQNGQRVWSTYYGGILHDISYTLTTDAGNNIILGGHTESPNAIATPGSFQDFYTLGIDVFIAKFDPNGVLQWGTYFGDNGDEEAWSVCCDNSNFVYCTGFTSSGNNISTGGTHQTNPGGMNDAFIFKLSPTGTTLSWSTYYGGTQHDVGTGIRTLLSGDVLVCGNTASPNAIASNAAYQLLPGSADDAFLVRLNTVGVRVWGTYFGGNDVDYFEGMQIGTGGDILLCGSTLSSNQVSSPGAWQSSLTSVNNYDAFLVRFNQAGYKLSGTYYGGSSNDNGYGISVDGNEALYICGVSTSADSIASNGSHMPTFSGGQDAFLARFCLLPTPVLSVPDTLICQGDSLSISTLNGAYTYLWNTGSYVNYVIIDDTTSAGSYPFFLTLSDNLGCTAYSDTSVITIDLCNEILEDTTCHWKLNSELVLQFCSNERKDLRIYSMNGSLLFQTAFSSIGYQLPVTGYSVGLYLLEITETGKVRSLKFQVH